MYTSGIRIGEIELAAFEIPSSIQFGGAQRLAIHRLSRGDRLIETLGPDEGDIRFQGVFSGSTAETRWRQLDSMRQGGRVIPFLWQSFKCDVIVRTLQAKYSNPWWIAFTIRLAVVQAAVNQTDTKRQRLEELQANIASAAQLIVPWPSSLNGLQVTSALNEACMPGSKANSKLLQAVASALAELDGEIALASSTVEAPVEPNPGNADAAEEFMSQFAAAARLAQLVNGRAYLKRIQNQLKDTAI